MTARHFPAANNMVPPTHSATALPIHPFIHPQNPIKMKATKHYEGGRIFVYIEENGIKDCITFRSEQQMARLGECLRDLARIGGNSVEINPRDQ